METAQWNNHRFTVSPQVIRGFTGLSIKGASETEDKESGKQQYASRKAGKPSEISLTAHLNKLTGCNVRDEALAFVTDAQSGATNYFYVGGKKLIASQLMLTEAAVDEVQIAPDGTWISCTVKLNLKQSQGNAQVAKVGGGGGGGGGGQTPYNKMSLKQKAEYRINIGAKGGIAAGAATKAVAAARADKARNAQQTINRLVDTAKKASKKSGSTGGGGGLSGRSSAVMMVR
ncbi:MAG: hypothetical protein ACOYI6_04145 [Christensenellales bacterium]